MRQYRFEYPDDFKVGLVVENPTSTNNKGFVVLRNLYPWDSAICYSDRFVTVKTDDARSQVFQIGLDVFQCRTTGVDKLVAGAYQTVFTFSESFGIWSCQDYIKFGILSNGDVTVYSIDGVLTLDKPFTGTMPKATHYLSLYGQTIAGGILDGWNNLDDTYVAWSKIGRVEFTLDKENDAGYHNPNIGHIKAIRQCNQSFVAFGTEGVAIYSPAEQTFSYRRIFNVGVLDANYTASSEQEVYFIDTLGYLRKIALASGVNRAAHEVTLLGYSWLFRGKACKMHWADSDIELRIVVENQKTFILNQYGMYETELAILGQQQDGTGEVICSVYGDQVQGDAYFETSPGNVNISGYKSITEVYILDSSPSDKFVSVISVQGDKEYRSKEYQVNALSVVATNISVDNFRIAYRVPNPDTTGDPMLTAMSIQTVKTDGRYGRGYQPQQMGTGG